VPAILLTRGSEDTARPTTVITRDSLQRIDPATNTLAATIAIGVERERRSAPGSGATVAAGDGAIWVSHRPDQTIVRIDPKQDVVAQVISAQGPGASIATGFGSLWLTSRGAAALIEIELQASVPIRTIRLDHVGWDVAVGHGAVWVLGDGSLSRVDPESGRVVARIDPTFWIGGRIAAGERGVWLARELPEPEEAGVAWDPTIPIGIEGPDGVVRIDPSTNELATSMQTPHVPFGIAASEGGIWISNNFDDSVWKIDPATNRVTRKIQVGDGPQGVAAGAGSVWVANGLDGTVSRIDPETGRVVATIEVGGQPDDIAVGEGGVWVTVHPA
jgi:YVTN family beta-propeller protein